MPPQSIAEDKQRIITQLQINLANMPDDPDACDMLFPQTSEQVRSIIRALCAEDFRPAEMQALLSILGPIIARTPVAFPKIPHRRSLRAV